MSCHHRLIQKNFLLHAAFIILNSAELNNDEYEKHLYSSYFYYQRSVYPRDCHEIQTECTSSNSSGIYLIKPDGYPQPFEVFCNNEDSSGGWTVVQRRRDGAVSFNRGWEEYREGFGFLPNDFWIGNEKLSFITNQAIYTLRIDMVLSNGTSVYVEYDAFRVSDGWNNYSLISVGGSTENASFVVNFTEVFTDCYDVYQSGQRKDGIYTILPLGWSKEPFQVPCNMSVDNGGWTVLQRRVNDSVNFNHNWEGYTHGFEILDHELWLGNEKIYYLTKQKDYELRLDMVNVNEDAYFAKYNLFRISSESFNYQLEVGHYDASSTTGFDAMGQHRGRLFSTPDRDNDDINSNCALDKRCGWWFGNDQGISGDCTDFSFNYPALGLCINNYPWWNSLPGSNCLIYTDIKIRPL